MGDGHGLCTAADHVDHHAQLGRGLGVIPPH
jgi:hypothetical protein